MNHKALNVDKILAGLKDFQQQTVEYVFRRMYLDKPSTSRFLVADEVGLGKTLVARGLIAKSIKYLANKVDRVDVVYVCSNAAIATQNVNRLNVTEEEHIAMATRLTLLPVQLKKLQSNKINFVSFTPGTTFNLRSRGGILQERAVLYRILYNQFGIHKKGLFNLFQATAGRSSWRWWANEWECEIDKDLKRSFLKALLQNNDLLKNLKKTCDKFQYYNFRVPGHALSNRYTIIGQLRQLLAHVCVDALEPDFVILDEFQRFKDLLDGDDEASELARSLLEYPDVRVLLLSATPYRMLTLDHEQDDDHYPDFIRTIRFLFGDKQEEVDKLEHELQRYRRALYGLSKASEDELYSARDCIQDILRSVMVRTERVAVTKQRDAMVVEKVRHVPLIEDDLFQARFIDSVSQEVDSTDMVEYWKSSPYLLNFMKDYDLKKKLQQWANKPSDDLINTLNNGHGYLLSRWQFERYKPIHPANARLRGLMNETLDQGQWQVLWVPPSLPYIEPTGPYKDVGTMTKSLIFSSWNVVPDAIAALCSYETERRMLGEEARHLNYSELYRKKRPLIKFAVTEDDKMSGMTSLALMYPCPSLAKAIDPLQMALDYEGGRPIPWALIRHQTKTIVDTMLRRAGVYSMASKEGRVDQRWYWAALAVLDAHYAKQAEAWCKNRDGWRTAPNDDEEGASAGFRRHIKTFLEAFSKKSSFGSIPDDLVEVITEFALGSPAICSLRALGRLAPKIVLYDFNLLNGAARMAEGFRTLFNVPESMGLLRSDDENIPYWRRVIQHGIEGNIQAVLDEYVSCLHDSLGLYDHPVKAVAEGISSAVANALSLRTARLNLDEIKTRDNEAVTFDRFSLRCRFALRFANIRDDAGATLARAETVRESFNSPFRPFILASTSIGQEGLDFHPYCHKIWHWNLPSNPIDLEQREGRIHRYKGHAVRKNVATRFGLQALRREWKGNGDPWEVLFNLAAEHSADIKSDLVPYWIYELDHGANIERRVPMLPFSRETAQLIKLKRSLAVYRLVFGQPRQEDLLAHLEKRIEKDVDINEINRWRISLAPIKVNSYNNKWYGFLR